ncbi:hypothetical protein Bca4012_064397 [Brassica carinata]|uniref:DUF223 domain-containing protein n=1 Tax=Brassica carinata TaxID=52824 RepID=A0A8X7SF54_BRACI|nr:hypothetical protein Bca52824_033987 [Brassica carinata]
MMGSVFSAIGDSRVQSNFQTSNSIRNFILNSKKKSAPLADLKAGKCSFTVEVRLLRFWKAKNFKRNGELMRVYMIFVDVKSTSMPATMYVNHLVTFRHRLNTDETDL